MFGRCALLGASALFLLFWCIVCIQDLIIAYGNTLEPSYTQSFDIDFYPTI